MANYQYTESINAIKLVKGPTGPKGATGPTGDTGATGAAGVQGAVGPDNLARTDISFSSNLSPAYKEIPVGEIVLIGHTTTNSLPILSSVKAIVGADTGDALCKAGLYLVNHSTENSGAATPMVMASSSFEIKGLGRSRDFKIVDFDVDASKWPTNDDVIGLWAYIEYPTAKIDSYLAEVLRLYGGKEAVQVKEALQKKSLLTRSKFYSALKNKYGINGGGILKEEQNVLLEAEQVELTKLKITQEQSQITEKETALAEGRRTLDYTSIAGSALDLDTWVSSNIALEIAYLQFT
jgi:hypothetical protein